MKHSVWLICVAMAALLVASLSGCLPSGQGQSDDEKEPHFLAGMSCVSSLDYKGAIAEFEKALEVNPRSAAAHFQLGCLYEDKVPDPAAAIYHFEQYLKLDPKAGNADIIRQHINNCKQDLAKTVLPLPITPGLQRQFEQLAQENKQLHDELDQWKAYAARLQAAARQPGPPPVAAPAASPPAQTPAPAPQTPANKPVTPVTTGNPSPQPAPTMRTHKVESGENPTSIARKYGINVDALMAANPGLDPRRLRIGQTLNIPAH